MSDHGCAGMRAQPELCPTAKHPEAQNYLERTNENTNCTSDLGD